MKWNGILWNLRTIQFRTRHHINSKSCLTGSHLAIKSCFLIAPSMTSIAHWIILTNSAITVAKSLEATLIWSVLAAKTSPPLMTTSSHESTVVVPTSSDEDGHRCDATGMAKKNTKFIPQITTFRSDLPRSAIVTKPVKQVLSGIAITTHIWDSKSTYEMLLIRYTQRPMRMHLLAFRKSTMHSSDASWRINNKS